MKQNTMHAFGWFVLLGLLLPLAYTVWLSFSPDSFLTPPHNEWSLRWYRAFYDDDEWLEATLRSIGIAGAAALLAVACAFPAAVAFQGGTFRGARGIALFLLLPACVPPIALGMAALPLFYRTGFWGTNAGLALMHATLGLPIALLILQSSWPSNLNELMRAARGLGANRFQATCRITLPLVFPAIVASMLTVFVLSLNESIVSILLTTPRTETLPAKTWPQLRFSPTPIVAVAACATLFLGSGFVALAVRIGFPSQKDR